MTKRLAKLLRAVMTPPVFAAALCTLLYVLLPGSFSSAGHFLAALGFLTGLPLLAYPVAALVPTLRRKGREGQRNLALVFSVLGYVGGFTFAMLADGTVTEKVLFATYLCSGAALAVCTLLHFKASGHTCGCSGPIAMLALYVSPWFLFCYPLLTLTVWSSRRLGRHTPSQLFVGAVIPVVMMFLCRAEFTFFLP